MFLFQFDVISLYVVRDELIETIQFCTKNVKSKVNKSLFCFLLFHFLLCNSSWEIFTFTFHLAFFCISFIFTLFLCPWPTIIFFHFWYFSMSVRDKCHACFCMNFETIFRIIIVSLHQKEEKQIIKAHHMEDEKTLSLSLETRSD